MTYSRCPRSRSMLYKNRSALALPEGAGSQPVSMVSSETLSDVLGFVAGEIASQLEAFGAQLQAQAFNAYDCVKDIHAKVRRVGTSCIRHFRRILF